MRTTLDIDMRVVAHARARVHAGQVRSLGEAISQMALAGLRKEDQFADEVHGLVLLPSVPNHVVTNDMVAEALLDG